MVIADQSSVLAIAGVKGGKKAEVDSNTVEIVIEVANFDGTSVRKTAQALNIFTDARKRFENDLSPELASYAMRELSATILEMCPEATFEDIVDVYLVKQEPRKLKFSLKKISKILGLDLAVSDVEDILKRYVYEYVYADGEFEIVVPHMRFDLNIAEDMADEIGRILGYDKVEAKQPIMAGKPELSGVYAQIQDARKRLLNDGYKEVITYVFRDKGEVSVLASASDKKFLRANLADGLAESLKLNKVNAPLLGLKEVKIFEIGTVFHKDKEEIHVAYNEKNNIIDKKLEEFNSPLEEYPKGEVDKSSTPAKATPQEGKRFAPWSLFPFIARDISVWMPNTDSQEDLKKIIQENGTELLVKEPQLVDSFQKGDQTSYAFRMVFQSYDRTLTDAEVNEIMSKITNKIKEKNDWQVR
jgi:phenylalanyl-tRNA synthetase beta subunit